MKTEMIYAQWQEHRRQVPVPENFTTDIMARIASRPPMEEYELPGGLTKYSGCAVQWITAAGLMLLGLLRIFYIAANLVRTISVMPY